MSLETIIDYIIKLLVVPAFAWIWRMQTQINDLKTHQAVSGHEVNAVSKFLEKLDTRMESMEKDIKEIMINQAKLTTNQNKK